ncbi:L-asparaginase II [Hartmannibacter diazotrophicus]|uniref:L-asparaginase II n=1 Tax=Hartmannibacter diazotrophicus TaxID=1482074 RepID=A0A2C9D3C3_9HYPH|nr:asparaginase [Hartmannibacter diazotrophicus]SON54827.1 L-asparaginase II [Hartmannibacter diazotrophicus]
MSNPVLVEVTRGGVVESRHRGSVVVVDADGRDVLALGNVRAPVFPRSAIKAFQALPLIESGAADRFGFGNAEIALACSSHNGEAAHVSTARRMLKACGCDEGCLECGPQAPEREADKARLARLQGRPARIHNNCSGKHSGFIATAMAMGVDPTGYSKRGHPVMDGVIDAVCDMVGDVFAEDYCGLDGCSIPTFAVPLTATAYGFAKFATGAKLGPERTKAVARIREAVFAEPFMVAGTGRFCTRAMTILGKRAFVKTGAEGVFTVALPEQGLGMAIKIDDGATRASEVVTAAVVSTFLKLGDGALDALIHPQVLTRLNEVAGEIRPAEALVKALDAA